jgi:hypothetical protein
MYIFPAKIARDQTLAGIETVSISAKFKAESCHLVEGLEVLQSQPFPAQQGPLFEGSVLKEFTTVEPEGCLIPAECCLRPDTFLLASGRNSLIECFCVNPQFHAGMKGKTSAAVNHDGMLGERSQVFPEAVERHMKSVPNDIGGGLGPEDCAEFIPSQWPASV